MIVQVAEIWVTLLVAFFFGCAAGAIVFRLIARSPAATVQWALAEALGRSGDLMRGRPGLAPLWRPQRRPGRRVALPVESTEAEPVWEVARRTVASADPHQAAVEEDAPLLPAFLGMPEADFDEALEAEPEAEASSREIGPDRRRDVPPVRKFAREVSWPLPSDAPALPAAKDQLVRAVERGNDQREQPRPVRPPRAAPPQPLPLSRADGEDMADGVEIRRPAMLSEPRNGVPDNLQRIRGVGERNEVRLNQLGIFHFSQIASWTPAELRWIGQKLAFPERIEHDDWVGQAIVLASGGETGFTKSAERRRARRRYRRDAEAGDDGPEEES
jgi:predicted flap endonuclease-1-like 5' DNA nuclease